MPGIICIIDDEKRDESLIDNMCSSIKHEPWYKLEKYVFQQFAVARVHLGIVNPEPQPIFNEDKSLYIFMDGEIFGYETEKRDLESKHDFKVNNDPEFCLHLYEEMGERFVEKLNGFFTILVLDLNEQRLLITNDRYGLRPLYYAKVEDKIYFAPEVKAILQDRGFNKTINNDAVAEFFTFGHLLGNKTFFKEINVFPPASIFTYQNGEFEIKKYWDYKFEEDTNYLENYYADELVKLFKQAVERRMKGDYRFGVLLSGGLDSRSILAAIDKKHYPIHTITFRFPNMDNSYKIAKKVSEKRGAIHKQLELKKDFLSSYAEKGVYLTDGMININNFHIISILDEIRGYTDITFNGVGGETLLGGVDLKKNIMRSENDREIGKILYRQYSLMDEKMKQDFFSKQYYNKTKGAAFRSFEEELKKSNDKLPGNRCNYFVFKNREKRYLGMVFNYPRSKFEDRAPFYDNDLINFILKIPPKLRSNHRVYIKFFKRLAPDLAKIPRNNTGIRADAPPFLRLIRMRRLRKHLRNITGGLICKSIKTDHPDLDEWIREDPKLNKFFKDIILDERTLNRSYFNQKYIAKVFSEHVSRKKDYSEILCAIVTFELWNRLFVDEEAKSIKEIIKEAKIKR